MKEILIGLAIGLSTFPLVSLILYFTDRIGGCGGDCRQGRRSCDCKEEK